MLVKQIVTPLVEVVASTNSSAATTDQIIEMWLHGKSLATQSQYRRVVKRLLEYSGKPIQWITLRDLQGFADTLERQGLAASTRRTYLGNVKSLLSFTHRTGLIAHNVGAALTTPKAKDCLAQRILSREDVLKLIEAESNTRNTLLLKVLYFGGLRVSELCSLTWGDLIVNGSSGQLLVFGKGGKTRAVLLPEWLHTELLEFRSDSANDNPIFQSRKGCRQPLTRFAVTRIVKAAAQRIGVSEEASAHWLRHCHASHSLDKGAPISLVQQTLGHSSVATTSRYLHARPNQSSALFL